MMLPTGKNNFVVRRASRAEGNTQYGFTLIEIMVSVAILSLGLVLILQGFAHCLNILRISEDNLKAGLMAENKIAEGEIAAKENRGGWKNGLRDEFQYGNISYVWNIDVESVKWELEEIPKSFEDLKEVRASLFWQEGKRSGSIPIVTYMREYSETE